MKNYIVIIILSILSIKTIAQNLISNGDFETYSSCPSGSGQLPYAIGWSSPPNNDAEYLHSCSTNPNYSVPNQNSFNFQQAHSGNAFIGIITYNWFGSNYREYAQKQLTSSLSGGMLYYVSFYINIPGGNYSGKYAINNLALSFQNSPTPTNSSTTSNNVLNYTPHIFKYGNPIISDTLNWIKVEGIYQSVGLENYIVIGNFKSDLLTDTLVSNGSTYPGSCCFIDDVSVTNITTPQWQYKDTTINYGDSVLIGPAITGLNVDWYNMSNTFIKNAPGIYVKPTVNTSYKAIETFNSATYNHTVNVTVLTTNVKEREKLNASIIYPSPCNGTFNIKNSNGLTKIIAILYDVNGKMLLQQKLSGMEQQINLECINKGIYVLELRNESSANKIYKKIIIQ